MEGLMLKTSVQSLIHHPQAGTQRSQTPAAQCQLALCSPFSSRSVSHSWESRHLASSAKAKSNRVVGAGVVVRAAAQTGEVVDMSALDGISIYTTFGKEVKFTDLWDQTNVSYRIPFLHLLVPYFCPMCCAWKERQMMLMLPRDFIFELV